jgi:hypothetical protein
MSASPHRPRDLIDSSLPGGADAYERERQVTVRVKLRTVEADRSAEMIIERADDLCGTLIQAGLMATADPVRIYTFPDNGPQLQLF